MNKISSLTFMNSGQESFPFRFSTYPLWTQFYHGTFFLFKAFKLIQERKLNPKYSFHLLNEQNRPIGISNGDIRYPAAIGELERLYPLIVQLEDRRFFSHFGIDIISIFRAAIANLRNFKIVQGGSTITQQLVRNTLLFPERSIHRKFFEVLLAIKLEKHFNKQEILELYCNHVYLGKGIRGFSAAAKIVFRKKLKRLNDTQLCGLLGLLRTPVRTFPENDCENFLSRQLKITTILKTKKIKTEQLVKKPNPIKIVHHRGSRF
ncbi:MAG: biosynthetic peptidoglycan transglycosylase, partial [Pseudomonadota bacterium]